MTLHDFIIRLIIAALIGIIIGFERQIGAHHIGIKTTFLIAIGTFSFCSIEILLGYDDIRMSANIVTGIGFLCSGVIFKNGLTVNGLNTSATLWSTSGISILIVYGYIKHALIAATFLVLFNMILNICARYIKPIKYLVDSTDEIVTFNIVCFKKDVTKFKNYIYDYIKSQSNIFGNIDSININNITEDKYRIIIKVQALSDCEDEYIKFVDNMFKNNVLSVSYEKIEH